MVINGIERNSYGLEGQRYPYRMTDDDGPAAWPPNMFKAFQEASEQQQDLLQQMLGGGGSSGSVGSLNSLQAMSQMAAFKTRIQSGGRISVPDAEREALDIEEGDIVQTVVIPVKRNRSDS